ncbi:hypothetical protein ACU4GD_10315 [Cupriavidus basilensis]
MAWSLLATREREPIPEYGDGVISVANLDAMVRNTTMMIDAAREHGRLGYNRAARHILDYQRGYRVALYLHRHLSIDRPPARALADRFDVAGLPPDSALARLRRYNRSLLTPVFGARLTTVLDGVLEERVKLGGRRPGRDARGSSAATRRRWRKRLLMLFALRNGASARWSAMREENVISREAYNQIAQVIQRAWRGQPGTPAAAQRAIGSGTARRGIGEAGGRRHRRPRGRTCRRRCANRTEGRLAPADPHAWACLGLARQQGFTRRPSSPRGTGPRCSAHCASPDKERYRTSPAPRRRPPPMTRNGPRPAKS